MNTLDKNYFGKIHNADGFSYVKGICGDEMEFYLTVQDDVIKDVKFFTKGCEHIRLCGETAARLVNNKRIEEALELSPAKIKNEIKDLPVDHTHCTILSTISLLKAIADYIYRIDDNQ